MNFKKLKVIGCMIVKLRRKQSTYIERWKVLEPRSKGQIKIFGTRGKGIKVGSIMGKNIGIRKDGKMRTRGKK